MIRVVTFDFWNTLLATKESLYERRAAQWIELLAEADHEVTEPRIREAFKGSWDSFRTSWKANRQHLTADSVDRVLELLEVEVPPRLRERLIDLYSEASSPDELALAPGLPPAIDTLRDAGVRIGIICDVAVAPGSTLRKELALFGVLDRFDHFSFSDEVGVYKPDPAIFAHALDGLGGRPEEAAHVGDLRRTDVAGARAAGWTSVRYTGLHDDPDHGDEADHVVADHTALPEVLGLT